MMQLMHKVAKGHLHNALGHSNCALSSQHMVIVIMRGRIFLQRAP